MSTIRSTRQAKEAAINDIKQDSSNVVPLQLITMRPERAVQLMPKLTMVDINRLIEASIL